MKLISSASILFLFLLSACYSPAPLGSPGNPNHYLGQARNWVIIMHGESCGDSSNFANQMYIENNHDSATIAAVVDIKWTANGQPQHENRTFILGPNSKSL